MFIVCANNVIMVIDDDVYQSHDDVIKWNHLPRYWRAGNSLLIGEFPAQWPVTRSFDILFDLRLNERLSKQW